MDNYTKVMEQKAYEADYTLRIDQRRFDNATNEANRQIYAQTVENDRQQIAAEGTAIAIDNKLVPKSEWSNRTLADGDKITLIRATFGG